MRKPQNQPGLLPIVCDRDTIGLGTAPSRKQWQVIRRRLNNQLQISIAMKLTATLIFN